ncbi:Aldo/keto reductase [Atractiella rhizophila]|nr:Aldo/keto reductase [Atractiella rhizophila]
MKYVTVGKSGLKVSKIVLGCMTYGTKAWGDWVLPEEEGIKHIKEAYRLGINTFDTANTYSNGESEVILGKAIKELNVPREKVVIMTKTWFAVGDTPDFQTWLHTFDELDALGYANRYGASRNNIINSVKASLERLQTDYIDLLQIHRFDPFTPISETMQALHFVVQQGWVRYIGMSSCYAYQFHAMQNYALNNNLTPFISMQNQYSALYREEEREMLPLLDMLGVGAIPWCSLGRGLLTRPYKAQSDRQSGDFYVTHLEEQYGGAAGQAIISAVQAIAEERKVSMSVVALAWIMGKKGVAAPLVGVTKVKYLEDLVGAVDFVLTKEEVERIEGPYRPLKIEGHA